VTRVQRQGWWLIHYDYIDIIIIFNHIDSNFADWREIQVPYKCLCKSPDRDSHESYCLDTSKAGTPSRVPFNYINI